MTELTPERVWLTTIQALDYASGYGDLPYVPESRLHAVEAERDEARAELVRIQEYFGSMDTPMALRAERAALRAALKEARDLIWHSRLYKGYGIGPLSEPWAEQVERHCDAALAATTRARARLDKEAK